MIEPGLCLGHQRAQFLGITNPQRFDGLMYNVLIDRPQEILHSLLELVGRARKTVVEIGQDLHRVLVGSEIDDHKVQILPGLQFVCDQAVAVKGHQNRAAAKGTALIHPPATRGRGDLALVGQFHLAPRGQLQVVELVKGSRRKHTDGRARREALLDGQVCLVVADDKPPDLVVRHGLIRYPGDIAPKSAAAGCVQKRLWI